MERPPADSACARLAREVRACRVCADALPHEPRPVLQIHRDARVLIAGQAPGRRVHESGVPFDDPSGDRLRSWMAIGKDVFYDARQVAIVPMSFCYPGTGRSGDLPPRPECAPAWHTLVLAQLTNVRLTIVLGRHAMDAYLPRAGGVTAAVREFRSFGPERMPLPHPSPRNNGWFSKNPWFETDVLPDLRMRVHAALSSKPT